MALLVQQLISELVFAPRNLLPSLRQSYADRIFDLIVLREEPERPLLLEAFLFHGPLGIQQDIDAWFRSQPSDPFSTARVRARRASTSATGAVASHSDPSPSSTLSSLSPSSKVTLSRNSKSEQAKEDQAVKADETTIDEYRSEDANETPQEDAGGGPCRQGEENQAPASGISTPASSTHNASDHIEDVIDGVLVHQIIAAEGMAEFFRQLFPPMDALPAKWDPDSCLHEALMRVFRKLTLTTSLSLNLRGMRWFGWPLSLAPYSLTLVTRYSLPFVKIVVHPQW